MDKMQVQETTEIVSALADGQLHGEAFARGVTLAAESAAGREAWATYHLIGDVLRSGEYAVSALPAGFTARLQARLAQEQVAFAGETALDVQPHATTRVPANDSNFRWKLVAGFASVAAVGAIGWGLVAGPAAQQGQPQLAAASQPATVTAAQGVMIRDARLDEFMAAHRQLGGASALQMPAGFLRNATFEPGAGR